MRRLLRLLALTLCGLPLARAHELRATAVFLDIGASRVEAEVQIPLYQLELAREKPLPLTPAGLLPAESASLKEYIGQHLQATTRDAKSAVLTGFGYDRSTLGLGVLGFNLGVEAMQLAVVTLTMPWLILLSRSSAYRFLRRGGACFGVVAAGGWLGQRLFGLTTPIPGLVEAVAARAPWGVLALAVLAVILTLVGKRPVTPRRTAPVNLPGQDLGAPAASAVTCR